ncbi:sugar phosphate nucleotidyltransferase [Thermophagus sp. OGC60D27]|uniref:sugar phosphate nucleotidyltransferase n=1 Tax=Thermophagus sp. OGC60D27 TaxID=3458415 RepID=UPI004037D0DF
MNAMIFAAGLGSRLRPLTNNKPKALMEIKGITMLELALKKLENAGISKTIVNVHHHRTQVIDFLKNYESSDMEIVISDEKERLLDTGGGLFKAQNLFDANTPVLLYNVDIVTNASLIPFIRFYEKEKPLVCLMVKHRPTSRYLLFNEKMVLSGWENANTGEKIVVRPQPIVKPFGFQGIHIVSPELFGFPAKKEVFSIMQLYLNLGRKSIIKGYETKDDIWFDIGTPEKLENTRERIELLSPGEWKRFFDA